MTMNWGGHAAPPTVAELFAQAQGLVFKQGQLQAARPPLYEQLLQADPNTLTPCTTWACCMCSSKVNSTAAST